MLVLTILNSAHIICESLIEKNQKEHYEIFFS